MIVSETVILKWCPSNKKHFESKGYKFIGFNKEFKVKTKDLTEGSSINIMAKCDKCGKEKSVRYSVYVKSVKNKGRYECNICNGKSKAKYSLEDIKKELEKYKYFLVDDLGYKKMHDKIKIRCNKGHEYISQFNSFMNGCRCPKCDRKRWTGTGNPRYNPELTEEQRELNKSRHSNVLYRKWFKTVFRRDKYTCCICGKTHTTLNAHHLNGFEDFKNDRLKVENGVTLCEDCHKKFHHMYGYGHNTEEQFIEFVINNIC